MDEKLIRLFDGAMPKVMDYGTRLFGAILILVVGKFLVNFVLKLLQKGMRKAGLDETLVDFSTNLVNVILMFLILLMSANTLGFDTTSFLAVIGAAGLAIGLALKGSLDNVASGFMLVILRQIHVGDYIKVGTAEGFVESINIFNTLLRARDNKINIVPNSIFTSSIICNYSSKGQLRAGLVFGISYEDDIPTAKAIIASVLKNNPRVLADPAPFVGVKEMNSSSIDLDVHAWVDIKDYWVVQWELTEIAKIELEAAGISIPFPQQDVHFYPHHTPLKIEQVSPAASEALATKNEAAE